MKIRGAADVLLRAQNAPLSSLLCPASTSRRASGTRLCFRKTFQQRSLTNSTRNNAIRPQATTSAAPAESDPSDTASPSKSVNDLTKSLFDRPSRSASRPDQERMNRMNGGNSAEDILEAMNKMRTGPTSSRFDGMLSPMNGDNKNMMQGMASSILSMPKKPKISMRLTPSTGRSVELGAGTDVARGLRLLEMSCARNRVRADFTYQRFHEREGLKRKRLRRQRWRNRFIEGFRATVRRVKKLKRQGW